MSSIKSINLLGGRSSDNLEVRLSDCGYNTYFKKRAEIANKKALRALFQDLKAKGVDIKKILEGRSDGWFD